MTVLAVQRSYQPSIIRVELLRSAKGVYGIGAVGTVGESNCAERTTLIVRPDKIGAFPSPHGYVLYQRIAYAGPFRRSYEGLLVERLHHAM